MCKGLAVKSLFVKTVCLAHPLVRVLVLAPDPLYGESSTRWAGPVFALDSPWAGPSLGTQRRRKRNATEDFVVSAPDLLIRHLIFSPGGSDGWENYSNVEAHQYVDITI